MISAVAAAGGHRPAVRYADITDDEECTAAVVELAEELGGLDVVVNNAARVSGVEPDGLFTTSYDLLRADFEEKVIGYLRVVRAAHPYLARSGDGRVINIGGEASRVARDNVSSGVRNAAVVHLTHTMAMALGPDGITVNAVQPGVVLTPDVRRNLAAAGPDVDTTIARLAASHALHRLVTPEEVARTVLFLASPEASGITAQVLSVSAGSTRGVYY